MKKTIAVICDNQNVDRYWLQHNVSIFIESKIINENFGNFLFASENEFDYFVLDIIKNLNLKTNNKYFAQDKNALMILSYEIQSYFNKISVLDDNCFEFIIKNADYVIFYVNSSNELLNFAKDNNKPYINFNN